MKIFIYLFWKYSKAIPKLTELFFCRNEKYSVQLYKMLDIYKYIPFERGGDGEERLKFAVQNIALALFADFLYQLLFQDKVDQLKKLIHSRYENYKKNLNNKKF